MFCMLHYSVNVVSAVLECAIFVFHTGCQCFISNCRRHRLISRFLNAASKFHDYIEGALHRDMKATAIFHAHVHVTLT